MSSDIYRDESISIAKGFAIILMVVCHAGCPKWAFNYIYMFHMPLFFFVSGYCFKDKYLYETKLFIRKRFIGLYLPYVKYTLLFLLLHNVFYHLNIYNDMYGFRGTTVPEYSLSEIPSRAFRIFFFMGSGEQLLGGFWFLKALLCGSIISLFILKITRNRAVIGCCIVFVISMILNFININIPYLGVGSLFFFAAFFFLCGVVFKRHNCSINLYVFVLLIISIGVLSVYTPANMLSYSYKKMIPYSIAAISGIIVVFELSKSIQKYLQRLSAILVFIGNNTINILTWHMLSFKLVSLLLIAIFGYDIKLLGCFPVIPDNVNDTKFYYSSFWIIYALVGVCIPLLYPIYKTYRKRY